jgi:molecular chaperone DnaJ
MENYYKILGVEENSDQETIKKSYRKLAIKFHPDKNKEKGAEDHFKKISEAYNILGDREKRRKYDDARNNNFFYKPFSGFNKNNDFGGFSNNNRSTEKNGVSLNITIQLNLQDILNGTEKKIKIKRNKKCNRCSGTGADEGRSFQSCGVCNGSGFSTVFQTRGFSQINTIQACGACNGKGKVILENCFSCSGRGLTPEEDIVDIKIPPGAYDGMKFVVDGKGDESKDLGKNGDLYINIKEIQDPRFLRRGIDLISIKEISFVDAVLGTKKEITLPSGETVTAVIEPGTIPGTVLKFSKNGLPNMGYGGRGDFLVEITIKIPKNLTQEEKSSLESLLNFKIFN